MSASLQGPGPVAAVDAMQKQDQGNVGEPIVARRQENRDVSTTFECRALEGQKPKVVQTVTWIGKLNCAVSRHLYSITRTPLALIPRCMSAKACGNSSSG